LSAARGIDNVWTRALALAEVAARLPAEGQPSVLGEALTTARGIDDAEVRAEALAEVAARLPADKALLVARGIDDAEARSQALAEVVARLPADEALLVERGGIAIMQRRAPRRWEELQLYSDTGQVTHYLLERLRILAMGSRRDCISELVTLLPLINALGGEATISSLALSIISVGIWWPSLSTSNHAVHNSRISQIDRDFRFPVERNDLRMDSKSIDYIYLTIGAGSLLRTVIGLVGTSTDNGLFTACSTVELVWRLRCGSQKRR
jgi:hypothetical protein